MAKNKIKVLLICLVILLAIVMFIQAIAFQPPYNETNSKVLSQKFLACGYSNQTDENSNFSIGNNKTGVLMPSNIHGTIFGLKNDLKTESKSFSEEFFVPLENVTVAILYNENELSSINNVEIVAVNNTKIWKAVLTNENGFYEFDLLSPGFYEIKAIKQGYIESTKKINLSINQSIKLDFNLEKSSSLNISYSENSSKIIEATKKGDVGSKITIWEDDNKTFDHEILIYDNINITKLDIEKGALSFTITGNESSAGKTISLNVDSNVFYPDLEILVKYDNESIKMADNLTDVLDPNNDGSNPEYIIIKVIDGVQILVSIPHFSEHQITIFGLTQEIVEKFGGVNAIILYIVICIVASIVFVGSIYVRRKI